MLFLRNPSLGQFSIFVLIKGRFQEAADLSVLCNPFREVTPYSVPLRLMRISVILHISLLKNVSLPVPHDGDISGGRHERAKMKQQNELTPRQRAARRARIHRLNSLAMKEEMEQESYRVHFGDDYRDKEQERLYLGQHDQWHLFMLKHRLMEGVAFESFDAYGNREAALDTAQEIMRGKDCALLVDIDREEYFKRNGEYPSW